MEKLLNYDGLEKFKEMNDETYANKEEVNESGIFCDENGYLYINEEED